jgi:DNA-binding CsgD family transcriptional regulator
MQTLRPRTVWAEKIVALDAQGEGYPAEAILRKMEFTGYSLFQLILHDLSAQVELKKDLQAQKAEVEKMNIALRQVIRTVEEERQEIREQLTSQVKKQLLPALERITKAETPEVREGYRNVIQEQLNGLTDTAGVEDADLLRLSPREMEVCQLIQLGRNGQEIAALLNMSFETVQTHRKNIRRKLGLKGRTVSLFSYLRRKPALS